MTDADCKGLLARITKLERQNRIWRTAGLLMLPVTLLSLTTGVTAQGDPGVRATKTSVKAQAFILEDSAGAMRGKMTVDGDRHPLLEFYDLNGNVIWSTDARTIPTR